jgi:hypothetical protein
MKKFSQIREAAASAVWSKVVKLEKEFEKLYNSGKGSGTEGFLIAFDKDIFQVSDPLNSRRSELFQLSKNGKRIDPSEVTMSQDDIKKKITGAAITDAENPKTFKGVGNFNKAMIKIISY